MKIMVLPLIILSLLLIFFHTVLSQDCDISSKTLTPSTTTVTVGDEVTVTLNIGDLSDNCKDPGIYKIYFSNDSSRSVIGSTADYPCKISGSIVENNFIGKCKIPTTGEYQYKLGTNYIFIWADNDKDNEYDTGETLSGIALITVTLPPCEKEDFELTENKEHPVTEKMNECGYHGEFKLIVKKGLPKEIKRIDSCEVSCTENYDVGVCEQECEECKPRDDCSEIVPGWIKNKEEKWRRCCESDKHWYWVTYEAEVVPTKCSQYEGKCVLTNEGKYGVTKNCQPDESCFSSCDVPCFCWEDLYTGCRCDLELCDEICEDGECVTTTTVPTTSTPTSSTSTTSTSSTTTTLPGPATAETGFFSSLEDCIAWRNKITGTIPRCVPLVLCIKTNIDLSQCDNKACKIVANSDSIECCPSDFLETHGDKIISYGVFTPRDEDQTEISIKIMKDSTILSQGSISIILEEKSCCEENEYCIYDVDCCSDLKCETSNDETIGTCKRMGTTSTTSTSSTTLPSSEVALVCDKDVMYVNEDNKCRLENCDDSIWFINGDPLDVLEDSITGKRISGGYVEFRPKKSGKILVYAICLSQEEVVIKEKEIEVQTGLDITCPDTCFVNEKCECKVEGCVNGQLTMRLLSEDEKTISLDIVDIDEEPFSYSFVPTGEGEAHLKVYCEEPRAGVVDTVVAIEPGTSGEFEMNKPDCTKESCDIEINKNSINEDVIIFIYLIDETTGKIYYSTMYRIEASETGTITVPLEERDDCPDGKRLEVLVLAYKESDLENRIWRLKRYGFEC